MKAMGLALFLVLVINTFAYALIYTVYTYAAKTMPGRIVYTAAVVFGTLIGSTLGKRWFG